MSGRRSSSFGENPSSKQRQWLHYCQHLHKVENMYATFLVVSTTDDISSIKLPSFSEIWKANRGGGHRARESPFQMGSGAGTNGCGPDSPSLWKSFGDERGGFLPSTTPWVGPQFTESYHRLSFVFFRWIIIVIAPFHKAANQWPRVNGVKHSGFRVALPQRTLQRRSSGTGVQGKHLLEGDTWEKENLCHLRADLWSNSSL